MPNNPTEKTVVPLSKYYTLFIVPFYYEEGEWDDIYSRIKKWEPITTELYNDEDVLFPYIMDLFKQNNPQTKSRIKIYKLDSKDEGTNSKMFTQRILGKENIAILAKNAAEKAAPKLITFRLLNDKSFAPHLYISPTARIGILTFSIELTSEKTTSQQIDLNYALHKRNETDSYQCVCLNPEKQEKAPSICNYDEISEMIPDLWKESQRTTMKNTDYICWNLNDFVDCIMGTLGVQKEGQKRIKYFSKHRMHLFSYCSIKDTENNISEADITPDLLRLSRCVDAKYMLPFNQLVNQGSILQTYENIFFASSIEGAAMYAIGRENNSSFIETLHQKFNRQYLLIYLLALIQRYTLQSIERKLTEFESTDKKADDELWKQINIMCRIKTNCYFTDVSIYTHHSQFYHLCCKNLHIPETFNEVSEKIELLKVTTDNNIQRLLKAQEQRHKDEMERIAKEEKEQEQRHKEEMERIAEEDKKAEKRQHILNWIIGILTIAQVMEASYELIKANHASCALTWSMIIGGVCFIILVCVMWKSFVNFFSKKHK